MSLVAPGSTTPLPGRTWYFFEAVAFTLKATALAARVVQGHRSLHSTFQTSNVRFAAR